MYSILGLMLSMGLTLVSVQCLLMSPLCDPNATSDGYHIDSVVVKDLKTWKTMYYFTHSFVTVVDIDTETIIDVQNIKDYFKPLAGKGHLNPRIDLAFHQGKHIHLHNRAGNEQWIIDPDTNTIVEHYTNINVNEKRGFKQVFAILNYDPDSDDHYPIRINNWRIAFAKHNTRSCEIIYELAYKIVDRMDWVKIVSPYLYAFADVMYPRYFNGNKITNAVFIRKDIRLFLGRFYFQMDFWSTQWTKLEIKNFEKLCSVYNPPTTIRTTRTPRPPRPPPPGAPVTTVSTTVSSTLATSLPQLETDISEYIIILLIVFLAIIFVIFIIGMTIIWFVKNWMNRSERSLRRRMHRKSGKSRKIKKIGKPGKGAIKGTATKGHSIRTK